MSKPVQFWIDVGGTFTDCIARWPDGTLKTHKLLSSGAYRGAVHDGSTEREIRDPVRQSDPDDFFRGFRLRLLARDGSVSSEHQVVRFEPSTGTLVIDPPLGAPPEAGTPYELTCGQEAPVLGVRWLLGLPLDRPTGPIEVRLGTTRGTNALLERTGAPTALVTTEGFADGLVIAYQNRPELFELNIRKPEPLYREVVEVHERVAADGTVVQPLDLADAEAKLRQVAARGITSLAICLVNAYRNPDHELQLERLARQIGFRFVSRSTEISRLPKFVARGDTTVVDAYLNPVIREYVQRIRDGLPEAELKIMTSSGSVTSADTVRGRDVILSGPAGGVVGAVFVGRRAGFEKVIGFDMGGTSTDVSRFDGQYERRYEMELRDPAGRTGVRIVAPMLAIETVAAGGGSICWFDGVKPQVGPRSAGADPGPACYGKGGPLCVTDVNLFLGKLVPEHFPFPLDRDAVIRRLDELIEQIHTATGVRYRREQLAEGFVQIANANMAAAIKRISISRGYDVRDYVLVSFGGAGAQHACAIARSLGIRTVLCSPYAGVLSALGIGTADVTKFAEETIARPYAEFVADGEVRPSGLEETFQRLERQVTELLAAEGIAPPQMEPPHRMLELRFQAQDTTITVPEPPDGDYAREFRRLHRQMYGFEYEGRPIEIYAARVSRSGALPRPELARPDPASGPPQPARTVRSYFEGRWHETPVYLRQSLRPGHCLDGPAIVVEPTSTVVIEPGWTAELTETDDIVLRDRSGMTGHDQLAPEEYERPDPVRLELFRNHFMSIAEQAGATLQKTALSTNVKERLDFSCAIFTPEGDLVANAPHIPVHLGAMSECVKCLLEDVREIEPGDVYVTNDPFRGGSHLPDVTVITPIFEADEHGHARLAFFAASRAHHAEIGGATPGSMPPFSRRLVEEGVLIRWFRFVRGGRVDEQKLRELLLAGPYPSRRPDDNIADIKAQVAANQMAANLLRELVRRYGLAGVHAYMRHIQDAAARSMRLALKRFPPGEYRFRDQMDDGTPIAVKVVVSRDDRDQPRARIDFSGTGPVHPGNLNANRAIVTSAVLYCLRCLIDEPIPLNAGVLEPIDLIIPSGTILNPSYEEDPSQLPAVVGGNVETSQRVVDVILGALGVVAASQGTMNNFLFGTPPDATEPISYYETIAGGAGAGPDFPGADAVHTHMTNTRITDVEILEMRFPVRLRRFAVRRGSGGAGRQRGGDGVVREIEFLVPLEVSLLTSRRTTRPYGLAGGRPGASGKNLLWHRSSDRSTEPQWQELGPQAHVRVSAGDILRIETPGGGGYGPPESEIG